MSTPLQLLDRIKQMLKPKKPEPSRSFLYRAKGPGLVSIHQVDSDKVVGSLIQCSESVWYHSQALFPVFELNGLFPMYGPYKTEDEAKAAFNTHWACLLGDLPAEGSA